MEQVRLTALRSSAGPDEGSDYRERAPVRCAGALCLAEELVDRYGLSAVSTLLAAAKAASAHEEITVAVLGRFKAGKSSFLNHLFEQRILPVGVVPVTAVVTEIRYGPERRARVRHINGALQEIPLAEAAEYITEKQNPENVKQVESISIELPEIYCFRGIRFVDTPGLESALAHNTRAVLDWLPNVGVALVAIGVDPPLSQQDVDLLKTLSRYTSEIAVLLTKADLLSGRELAEVLEYVRSQLSKDLIETPRVFPYSTRPGFEHFRNDLQNNLPGRSMGRPEYERDSIVMRKTDTVLAECGEFLTLSLKAAETAQSERETLKQRVIRDRGTVEEVKSQVRLAVQHTAAQTRKVVSERLEKYQSSLESVLTEEFDRHFPEWTASLSRMLASFEEWLAFALRRELGGLSIRERTTFLEPLRKVQSRTLGTLQQFRDRLSEQTMRAFGVPLRTTETEIKVQEPAVPDIRVGRVFDRNWELLSPILPVWAIRSIVRRHFARMICRGVDQNISRLSSQWEESINVALWSVEKEASWRLSGLVSTVELLIENSCGDRIPELRLDLERIAAARRSLSQEIHV